jgi:hypothetical protein
MKCLKEPITSCSDPCKQRPDHRCSRPLRTTNVPARREPGATTHINAAPRSSPHTGGQVAAGSATGRRPRRPRTP